METAPEPAPPDTAQSGDAAEPGERRPVPPPVPPPSAEPMASQRGTGERGLLRPPPRAPAHAPRLLGIDAAGGEHPQGPGDPDDEALVGRCWGCGCGWRGTVRDVATRHFRPQVGDRGGLRRKRLARADRDARPELDNHLAAATATPISATPTAAAAPRSSSDADRAGAGAARPRGRRRLTLPRTTPQAPTPTPDVATAVAETPRDEAPNPDPPPGAEPDPAPEPAGPPDGPTEATGAAPDLADPGPDPAGRGGGDLDRTETPAPAATAGPGAGEDRLTAAATRARTARAELDAAETALDAAVAAARADGASWRTVARATGIPHRDAAAHWGQEGAGPSL